MKGLQKMHQSKQKIIDEIIKTEGGYVNNPNDRGGETKYGITKKVARKSGYKGEMKNFSYDQAFKIYSEKYWDVNMLDDVFDVSEKIAVEIADTGVNMGTSRAAKFLQRSLNVLNKKETLFDDVKVDGRIGLKTVSALKDFLKSRGKDGETVLLRMLNALQVHKYIRLAEKDKSQEAFEFGWVLHRG